MLSLQGQRPQARQVPSICQAARGKNVKVPANYESAYNKAKKAWVEAKKSKGAHAKAMKTEGFDHYEDTEDEDASSDEDGASTFGFAIIAKGIKPKTDPPVTQRAPKLTSRFAPLMTMDPTDDDTIPDGEMLDRLNGWADRVHVKGENAGRAHARPNKSTVVISTVHWCRLQ